MSRTTCGGRSLLAVGSILGMIAETANSQERLTLEGHDSYVNAVAFTPSGESLLSVGRDLTGRFWDVQTGRLRTKIEGLDPIPRVVAFSPDGKTLAIGVASSGSEGKLLVAIYGWDGESATLRARVPAFTAWPDGIAFSPDGRWLACGRFEPTPDGSHRPQVHVVETATGKIVATVDLPHEGNSPRSWSARSFAFSSDGRELAVGAGTGTVCFLKVGTWERTRKLPGMNNQSVVALDYAPDGDLLVTRHLTSVTVHDAKSGDPKRTVAGTFLHADLSPDGRRLAAVTLVESNATPTVNRLSLWDVASLRKLSEVSRPTQFRCVRFAPDGKSLATANVSFSGNDGPNQPIVLWDVAKLLEMGAKSESR